VSVKPETASKSPTLSVDNVDKVEEKKSEAPVPSEKPDAAETKVDEVTKSLNTSGSLLFLNGQLFGKYL
jgi:hypothetical protein